MKNKVTTFLTVGQNNFGNNTISRATDLFEKTMQKALTDFRCEFASHEAMFEGHLRQFEVLFCPNSFTVQIAMEKCSSGSSTSKTFKIFNFNCQN